MPQLNVSMDGVQDTYEPLPKGRYTAMVDSVTYGLSQAQQPKLTWSWMITSEGLAGRKILQTTSLQPQALWVLKMTLKGLGLPHTGNIPLNWDEATGIVTQPEAVGLVAFLDLSITTDGKYNQVDLVASISGSAASTGPLPVSARPSASKPALVTPGVKSKPKLS